MARGLGGGARHQWLDVLRPEGSSADAPVTALDFLDDDPRLVAEFLAFDGDAQRSADVDHMTRDGDVFLQRMMVCCRCRPRPVQSAPCTCYTGELSGV